MTTEPVAGDLPSDRPLQMAFFGRKGSGKSELAWTLWESWPYDRMLIDITGDVGRDHPDPHTHDLPTPPPARWPAYLREHDEDRLSLRYVPDMVQDTWLDDIDRLIGMSYEHGLCLLWVDDAGVVVPNGLPMPHARRTLHMGRHRDQYSMWTMPRPSGIDPLVWGNADVTYIFDLPNPADRNRVADVAGVDRKTLASGIDGLPDHGYLRHIAQRKELVEFPPIPLPSKRQRVAESAFLEDVN
jgi:hypothetical protein